MSVVEKTVAEVAVPKLSGLFRYRATQESGFSYLDVLNFAHIVGSKGLNWDRTAENILERCPRNAYYLWLMSRIIVADIKFGVLKSVDVERSKILLAYIQAKRSMSKI